MRHAHLTLRLLLLVALLFAGTVPAGMMPVSAADGDGMRLVLCTDEGPREVWLAADGTVTEATDSEDDGHRSYHCVQVSLFTPDWALPDPEPLATLLRPAERRAHRHQVACALRLSRGHPCRAPPVSA
ncbi:hypothetical protein [Phaeobacter sp. HF9A]|uniref:hypothetical protein n=1 Tax=Phaeobacter sp. HF9A TaxID=2721561 RepID=UPI001430E915|nr:hypothetical protein [Phaeobacter sp. HF9A]NIZ12986.1 hypothetical protein [Phaeobacter sp. HF9A]